MARLGFMALLAGLSLCFSPVSAVEEGLLGGLVETATNTLEETVDAVEEVVTSVSKTLDQALEDTLTALTNGEIPLQADLEALLDATLPSSTTTDCVVTFVGSNDLALSSMSEQCKPVEGVYLTEDERAECIRELVSRLGDLMTVVQSILWELLGMLNLAYQPCKTANLLYIPLCTPVLGELLSSLPTVNEVLFDLEFQLTPSELASDSSSNSANGTWNVMKVKAEDVWNTENTGQGIRVATLDSGVRGTHEALRDNFMGNEYEGYGWYDPLGGNQDFVDDYGHGTHTMGSLVGSHGLGIAPGAQWMTCRMCSRSGCSGSSMYACADWIMEPTKADGSGGDTSLAPHIVSNSWYAGQGRTYFDAFLNAWHTARIIPVFSAGNLGRDGCETVQSPADAERAIAVGATDTNDNLGDFSSHGPSMVGSRIKPDFTAPGVEVLSAWGDSDTDYRSLSGTSMATPIVAGTIALMLHARPCMNLEEVVYFLSETAEATPRGTYTCGSDAGTTYKNNENGYGRIDAYRAYTITAGYNAGS